MYLLLKYIVDKTIKDLFRVMEKMVCPFQLIILYEILTDFRNFPSCNFPLNPPLIDRDWFIYTLAMLPKGLQYSGEKLIAKSINGVNFFQSLHINPQFFLSYSFKFYTIIIDRFLTHLRREVLMSAPSCVSP